MIESVKDFKQYFSYGYIIRIYRRLSSFFCFGGRKLRDGGMIKSGYQGIHHFTSVCFDLFQHIISFQSTQSDI